MKEELVYCFTEHSLLLCIPLRRLMRSFADFYDLSILCVFASLLGSTKFRRDPSSPGTSIPMSLYEAFPLFQNFRTCLRQMFPMTILFPQKVYLHPPKILTTLFF